MSEPTQLSLMDAQKQLQIEDLEKKRDEYSDRLDDGMVKIENAQTEGKDTTAWEAHWIKLLRQYEAVVNKLKEIRG